MHIPGIMVGSYAIRMFMLVSPSPLFLLWASSRGSGFTVYGFHSNDDGNSRVVLVVVAVAVVVVVVVL